MTIEMLDSLLHETRWFEHLGKPLMRGGDNHMQIPNLHPWADLPTGDDNFEKLADEMEWLPSSRDQVDPIHGKSLDDRCDRLGRREEFSRCSLQIYTTALASLRKFSGHPTLKIGPHDFTEAARGSALYTLRRATMETILGECGFWTALLPYYSDGHWPCGILPNGVIVVL